MKIHTGYESRMTQEMLNALPTKAEVQAEGDLCRRKIAELKALDLSLPNTAASGEPVVHGARMVFYQLQSYWDARYALVRSILGYHNEELDI